MSEKRIQALKEYQEKVKKEIKDCSSKDCALYEVRPYK